MRVRIIAGFLLAGVFGVVVPGCLNQQSATDNLMEQAAALPQPSVPGQVRFQHLPFGSGGPAARSRLMTQSPQQRSGRIDSISYLVAIALLNVLPVFQPLIIAR